MKTPKNIPEERNVTIRQDILKQLEYGELTIGERTVQPFGALTRL
jgi:hypothetical protein